MIGEGYERLMDPKTKPEEDDYKFHGALHCNPCEDCVHADAEAAPISP